MPEMPFAEPTTPDAFIVRGHHATRLYNVLAVGMSIDTVIENAEKAPAPYRGYRTDVWGTTPEDAAVTNEGVRTYISNFLDLPDATTVRFVAGRKDAICDSCAIGAHCEATSPKGDSRFLTTIGRLAREKGLGEVLVEQEVTVEGWKTPSPVVELPAWAAKLILGDPDFHAQTFPKPIRPLARMAIRRAKKTAN